MSTIPRLRQTQDHELLVMARVCDLLATLNPEPRARVVAYVMQRVESLVTVAASGNGASEPGDLFEAVSGGETDTAAGG